MSDTSEFATTSPIVSEFATSSPKSLLIKLSFWFVHKWLIFILFVSVLASDTNLTPNSTKHYTHLTPKNFKK
jgi:hypothetical protein